MWQTVFSSLSLTLSLDFLPQSSISPLPSFIITMKIIVAIAILALASTVTWAVSPSGKLGFTLNTHAFIMLTVKYSAFGSY